MPRRVLLTYFHRRNGRLPLFASLKVKFVTALILMVLVVISLSTGWNLHMHRRHMLQATEEKVQAYAAAVDRGIQVAMRERHSAEVQRILEELAGDPDIQRITIFNTEGRILRSSDPAFVGRTMERDRLSQYLIQPEQTALRHYEGDELIQGVVRTIRNRPECYPCHSPAVRVNGILHVDMSFRRTQEQIADMEWSAVATVVLAALLLSGVGALLLIRLVDRPIETLTRAMAHVESGDLEARAPVVRQDELGQVADSFNRMVDRLKAAREEIETYHRQRLERAERLASMGELAASLAHEIKNPLAGIAGAVQVIADDLPAGDTRKEILHEILAQVRRLDKTVRDLLAFARPGKPDVGPCDIHEVLDRALLLLAENPDTGRVRVLRAYQTDLPRLEADSKQMGQVFLNLVLNAMQAMQGGGQLSLRTALREDDAAGSVPPRSEVEIEVADTGPGIPPHLLEEIFTPFVSTKHRGTGLGLSVSRRIIEDHGGTITAENRPGGGAMFRVRLPLEVPSRRRGGARS